MDNESEQMTTTEKIEAVVNLWIQTESTIMGHAALTQEIWEETMTKGMLGELYPTKIVVRALLTEFQRRNNQILYETVLEYFSTGQVPKRTKEPGSKDWYNLLREESALRSQPELLTATGLSTSQPTITPMIEKMKLELKLEVYDGTKDACEDWFYELEKTLRKIKVCEHDFLLYASNNTTGLAKNAITMLETKLGGDYLQIKAHLISMFDGITNQQTYEFFQKNFKQTNVESVTTFYIKYQVQVQKLLAQKIWLDDSSLNFNEVSCFRSKLRQDISLQTALILQQQDADNSVEHP
jgi:hypothetical protein